jgi:spore coat protein U-like protein
MKQRNQTMLKTLGVAMMLVGANAAMAETVTVPASVTVNNAIDFSFTGTLDFGQVRATPAAASGECAGLVMGTTNTTLTAAAAGSTGFDLLCTDIDGALQSVGGTPARPVFTIAGVAPFATLTLALPAPTIAAAVNLTAPTGPNTPQFKLTDFTARKTSGTPVNLTNSIMTDADGGATFTVGATLITEVAATTATYQDMVYSGEFDVSVSY